MFQKPLSLAAISFGMFTEPEGTVEFVGVTVVKGRAGGFSDNPDFCTRRKRISAALDPYRPSLRSALSRRLLNYY